MRDDLNYDHVESVSGVDYPENKEIEVVYHIGILHWNHHWQDKSLF